VRVSVRACVRRGGGEEKGERRKGREGRWLIAHHTCTHTEEFADLVLLGEDDVGDVVQRQAVLAVFRPISRVSRVSMVSKRNHEDSERTSHPVSHENGQLGRWKNGSGIFASQRIPGTSRAFPARPPWSLEGNACVCTRV
jgi:hypothetical protein